MKTGRGFFTGMRGFSVVWFGQLFSLLGTSMSQFALSVWAWQMTGTATALALTVFFTFGPSILISPIAGVIVDRWNRKLIMILSDVAAGLVTIGIFLLYMTDSLQVWHLWVAGALSGVFQSFQMPAYYAAITTMVARDQYGRANGMMSLIYSVSEVAGPFLGGALVGLIGIGGIVTIDVVTFLVAVVATALVVIPQPAASDEAPPEGTSFWSDTLFGFRYIWARPSLRGLQLIFMWLNVMGGLYLVLLSPMILARSGQTTVLGTVLSCSAVGAVGGGLVLTAWGGPKRRVSGVLSFMILISLLGVTLIGLGRSIYIWVFAVFCWGFLSDLLNGTSQAIWQSKVAPDVQGRVFATRRLIAQVLVPVVQLSAGPLADKLFEPAMKSGGALASLFGGLVGTGAGAGMGLLMLLAGLIGAGAGVAGFLSPAVRQTEELLPDHEPEAMEA